MRKTRYSVRLSRKIKNIKTIKELHNTNENLSFRTNLLTGQSGLMKSQNELNKMDPQSGPISKSNLNRLIGETQNASMAPQSVTRRSIPLTVNDEWRRRWSAKQILKDFYRLTEKKYIEYKKLGYTGKAIIEEQERRVEVVMFRMGWANSIEESRKLLAQNKIKYIELNPRSVSMFGNINKQIVLHPQNGNVYVNAKWGLLMNTGSCIIMTDVLHPHSLESTTNVWKNKIINNLFTLSVFNEQSVVKQYETMINSVVTELHPKTDSRNVLKSGDNNNFIELCGREIISLKNKEVDESTISYIVNNFSIDKSICIYMIKPLVLRQIKLPRSLNILKINVN